MAALATDIPFAFRVRVEDDAITVKDIKAGPFGSPLFAEMLGKGDGKELLLITGMVGGKYKADPNPDRNAAPPVVRPKKK